eukprot:1882230-Rhodomonas_salina.2
MPHLLVPDRVRDHVPLGQKDGVGQFGIQHTAPELICVPVVALVPEHARVSTGEIRRQAPSYSDVSIGHRIVHA